MQARHRTFDAKVFFDFANEFGAIDGVVGMMRDQIYFSALEQFPQFGGSFVHHLDVGHTHFGGAEVAADRAAYDQQEDKHSGDNHSGGALEDGGDYPKITGGQQFSGGSGAFTGQGQRNRDGCGKHQDQNAGGVGASLSF